MDIKPTSPIRTAGCSKCSNLIIALIISVLMLASVSPSMGQEWGRPPQPDDPNLSERFVHSVSPLIREIEQQYDPPLILEPVERHIHTAVEKLVSLHREWRLIRQYELKRNARLTVEHPQLASPDRGVYGGRYFPPGGNW